MTLAEAARSASESVGRLIGVAQMATAEATQATVVLQTPAMDLPIFRAAGPPLFRAGLPLFRAMRLSDSINFLPTLLSESINFVPGAPLFRAGPPLFRAGPPMFRVPDWAFFTWPEWAFIFSEAPQRDSTPFQIKGGLPR